MTRKRTAGLLIGVTFLTASVAAAQMLSRSALGAVVAACSANATITSSPFPCLYIHPDNQGLNGYAILREPVARNRLILAATNPIDGIEDPRLLSPDGPNFFADAWIERRWLRGDDNQNAPPPVGFALAMNGTETRTQDRLHVHIACLRTDIQERLAPLVGTISLDRFTPLKVKLSDNRVWAMRIDAASVDKFNPIQVLYDKLPEAHDAYGRHILIAVREKRPDGGDTIVLLTNGPTNSDSWFFSVEPFLTSDCS